MTAHALITIDPGYAKRGKGCAVAIFVNSHIRYVGFATIDNPYILLDAHDITTTMLGNVEVNDPGIEFDEIVWECPQVDARTRMSTPAVVKLAAVGGALAGLYAGRFNCRTFPVAPSTWKGSAPKPVHHGRLWKKLDANERALLGGERTLEAIDTAKRKGGEDRWAKDGSKYYPASWLTHNLLDAVGIGMWRLGR